MPTQTINFNNVGNTNFNGSVITKIIMDGVTVWEEEKVLTMGSYSHQDHYNNSGTVSHTVGSINVPVGRVLDYFYIKGQGVSDNVSYYIDWIQIGGVTVYGGNLTEASTSGDGNLIQTSHTIPTGNQSIVIGVYDYYEDYDRLYIQSMKFVFN